MAVKNPLDAFIEKLRLERSAKDGDYSIRAHAHASAGFVKIDAAIKRESTLEGTLKVPQGLQPGSRVTWESPLFGQLSGEVLAVVVDSQAIEVFHPLTQRLIRIPAGWVIEK